MLHSFLIFSGRLRRVAFVRFRVDELFFVVLSLSRLLVPYDVLFAQMDPMLDEKRQ